MKTINSFRSKLLALTLALMASVSTFAYEFEYVNDFHINGFAYKVLPSNTLFPYGSAALIEIADCNKDVVIPEFVSYGNTEYRIITFGMGSVVFTNDASSVVESITIPKTIDIINKNVLAGCPNLKTVVVDSENPYYDSRENCNAIITTSQNPYFTPNTLIAGCKTTIIPNSVAEIGDNAFYNSALESITIPTGTTKIGRSAFNNSILLSSITLSATLIEISDWAFADCFSLNTIICYAIEPPTISSNTFFGSNPIYNNPTIYVPAESVEAYKNAEHWKWFTKVLPIEPTSYKSQWCDTWNILVKTGSVHPPVEEIYRYQLAQDTVIGDYTYTAVVQKEINDALDAPHYVAAVRFTDDRKVYVYYDNAEYLLYDFNVQEGDELEVFAGINNYTSEIKTYKCTVTGVEQYACVGCPATITLQVHNHPNDFREFYRQTQWIEGVGDINGFLNGINHYVEMDGGGSEYLLCAHKGDELKYTGPLYEEYGCGDDAEQTPEDLFPTLWGLQRTHTIEMYDHAPNDGKRSGGYPLPFASVKDTVINGKTYLQFGDYVNGSDYSLFFLREENNKVLIYSSILQNDLVLYDYTLELGDSLPAITSDHDYFSDDHFTKLDKAKDIFTYVVTDVSTVTLLDGIERKKWILKNKYLPIIEYVEGIGCYGENTSHSGDFFRLIYDHPYTTEYVGDHLVCVSKNGQLLYSMPQEEINSFTLTCECLSQSSYKDQWCDTWNVMWFDGMRFDETASTSKYRLGKDTIIGDYTYSKFNARTYVRFTSDRKVYVYYEGFDDNDPYTPDLPTGEYLAYDFSAKVGDTLEVFSGIGTYSTYPCVVDDVQIDSETNLRTMTLHKICRIEEDGFFEEYDDMEMTWIEGVGSPEGFLISYLPCGWVGGGTDALLCAYKDDELKYTGSFYERFGCDYKAGVVSDDLFPTLSGLQRTICREYYEQADNKTRIEQYTNLTTRTETGGPYIYCSPFLLREKDNKILIYSRSLDKDLVLYDFNLQVGDSLPMLYIDFFAKDDWIADRDMELWCVVDYHKDLEGNILPADTLIVTDVSAITLLDGKEYKKWTFNNGMEYVEGIGSFGNRQWSGDFFQLIANRDVPTSLQGEHLVCVSKNNKLLYQMDDAEMERLGAECLCEAENPEDLFPTLWGLQQTICSGYYGEEGDEWASGLTGPSQEITMMDGKPYLQWGSWYLREENDKILVYSEIQKKDLVLYDFTLELGDTLTTLNLVTPEFLEYEGIVGIVDYPLSDYDYTYPIDTLVVTELSKETLLDGKEYTRWKFSDGTVYVEGIGSMSETFFHHIADHLPVPVSYLGSYLVCVSKNNKLLYQMDDAEMERLGAECLCEAENPEDLFPTLWGLQRTVCKEYYGETEDDNSANNTYKQTFDKIFFENDKPYILCNDYLLREEDNKILIYSQLLNKDLVLYDFTLEVGDSLPALYIDYHARNAMDWMPYNLDVVDYYKSFDGTIYPADTFVVTDVSNVTLFDGKEYKKWTFNNGMEYVEGIGSFGNRQWSGDFFQLIANRDVPTSLQGEHLVCASRNGQLLYQMDEAEMERLGAECLCEYNSGPKKDHAKDGQIGGRPTPTQWNQLEVVLRQMDNNHTILQAETFSYTLEDISQQVNNKTYFQLARQSTKDTATTKSVVGALHFGKDEDNRVYFLRDGVEYVLYDFTAEPGDTVEIFAGINNYPQETTYTHVVVDKDTTEDGACRMLLEVVFPDETTAENAEKVWLAGLGSVDGIVHNAAKRTSNAHAAPSRSARSSETESSVMLCAWREDSCLYTTDHPDYDTFGCVYNQEPTSVKDIHSSQPSYQKLLRDGQLFIIHDGKTYNVLGVKVN